MKYSEQDALIMTAHLRSWHRRLTMSSLRGIGLWLSTLWCICLIWGPTLWIGIGAVLVALYFGRELLMTGLPPSRKLVEERLSVPVWDKELAFEMKLARKTHVKREFVDQARLADRLHDERGFWRLRMLPALVAPSITCILGSFMFSKGTMTPVFLICLVVSCVIYVVLATLAFAGWYPTDRSAAEALAREDAFAEIFAETAAETSEQRGKRD